jgi:hypothetical protein
MKQNHYLLIILSLSLFTITVKGQFYFSTSIEGYYDDNIFNNYLNSSDFVNAFSGEVGYDFETERNNLEIYYIGFINRYYKFPDKSSVIHKIGAVNTFLFSDYDNPLNVGLNFTTRVNREDYYIYDFNQFSVYANYRHSISESNKIQFGVIGNRIDYENFSLFSHYQLKAFLRSVNSFESRTSLTVAAEIDRKNYIEDKKSQGFADEVLQAKLYLQLGQGISDKLGIGSFVFLRNNISGGNRYFSNIDYVFYEEELFNDIYSNEGIETGLTLSYLFLPNIMGKIAGRYEIRNYTDLPAADEEGNDLEELRQDDQFSVGASMEFGLGEIISGLYLVINYNYIKNTSNDYYYDFTNQIYAVTLGFDF